jgi:hypothetical protein
MAAAHKAAQGTTVVHVLLILLAALVLFALVAYYNRSKGPERFNASSQPKAASSTEPAPVAQQGAASDSATFSSGASAAEEPVGNQMYRKVRADDAGGRKGGDGVRDPFPQDSLSPEDLLPKDAANSFWSQSHPAGTGDVKDQNFLTAGYHIGMNTIGQSMRNANYDLRSAPPNPQFKVSIWQQSTIEPDLSRRPLE